MNKEKFGSGKEWDVYEHPINSERLIKVSKVETLKLPNEVIQRFYLGKILHILFPNNIPDVHAVQTKDIEKIEVQKIHLDNQSNDIRYLYQDKSITTLTQLDLDFFNRIKVHPDYKKLTDILNDLGLPLDPMPENFGFDTNNNLFYLDSDVYDPTKLRIPMSQVITNIRNYANSLNSKVYRQKVETYLVRLEEQDQKTKIK